MGYYMAGFKVVGVDNQPRLKKSYPFEFVCADALEYLDSLHRVPCKGEFQAIHASPPCQAYSSLNLLGKQEHRVRSWLIPSVRSKLASTGVPYVIENVVGARSTLLRGSTIQLCGSMFGLNVRRHRLFESNLFGPDTLTPKCRHGLVRTYGVYGDHPENSPPGARLVRAPSLKVARLAMDIDWMDWEQIKEAIPPAYTKWIGLHLKARYWFG